MLLAATFGYCIASALIPIFNAEAYVGVVAAAFDGVGLWAVASAAAAGQMVGKLAYFLIGRRSLQWAWVRTKLDTPKRRAALLTWQRRIGGNPWVAALVLLASAFVGIPPFAVMSVIAGQLKVPAVLFLVVGFAGRLGRFASILGIAGMLVRH